MLCLGQQLVRFTSVPQLVLRLLLHHWPTLRCSVTVFSEFSWFFRAPLSALFSHVPFFQESETSLQLSLEVPTGQGPSWTQGAYLSLSLGALQLLPAFAG